MCENVSISTFIYGFFRTIFDDGTVEALSTAFASSTSSSLCHTDL
jgi:hypothetical protein